MSEKTIEKIKEIFKSLLNYEVNAELCREFLKERGVNLKELFNCMNTNK